MSVLHKKTAVFSQFARLASGAFVAIVLLTGMGTAPVEPDMPVLLEDSSGFSQQLSFRSALQQFYAARNFSPIWFQQQQATDKAHQLVFHLQLAASEGLEPDDYQAQHLSDHCLKPDGDNRASCELQLSDAFLHYARDVGFGRYDPHTMDGNWHIPARQFEAVALLKQAAQADRLDPLLDSLPPAHAGYAALRRALAGYQLIADNGGWPAIGSGATLTVDSEHADVERLRQRLRIEFPDVALQPNGARFDDELKNAVLLFQHSRGLEQDGVVGPLSRQALDEPIEHLLASIRLNMERWRWLPQQMGQRHVLVNVPAFELFVVDESLTIARMRAITGRRDRSSPSFQSRLSSVVFNPSWFVPRIIAVEDILPQQQQDPDYLASRNIRVLQHTTDGFIERDSRSIDWQRYHKQNFPFILHQPPGPQNSLGQIKFITPNPFSIFLHDTPAKALFQKRVRTLSSGCIRLQQPLLLASLLLDEVQTDDWRDRYQQLIDSGSTHVIELTEPVPVYVVYLTSWVDDGIVHFHEDVYSRDEFMLPLFDETH
ncbi:MAG: L,D-transpeptidase family protein [Chromatiales bacterium]|jgi:murein L,D-transpeptidase YcbB/YkuD